MPLKLITNMNLENALIMLKREPVMSFATSVDDQPFVRFMTLVNYQDEFYCVTFRSREKTEQLLSNPKFSFVVLLEGKGTTGSIRCRGKTEIITDRKVKKKVSEVIPWHSHYWDDYSDPEFTLIRLHINHVTTFDPESKERISFDNLDL
jgi:general stress protein 26